MSSRNFTEDRGNANTFREKKVLDPNRGEKKLPRFRDSFFIKPCNKNKKNALNVSPNVKNTPAAFRKVSQKKEKPPRAPQDGEPETKKRLFDKKAWRFKRYSNKYKLEQWKEVRKTNLMRGYDKTLKTNDTTRLNFVENDEKYIDHSENRTQRKTSTEGEFLIKNAKITNIEEDSSELKQTLVFNKSLKKKFNKGNEMDEERNNKKLENDKRKAAKEVAIKEYKRKKMEKYKKLSRKTKKGQPVMKDRIEVLLEEIQKSIG